MPDTATTSIVALLKTPGVYPEAPREVEAIETHMSWVFLTDAHAYKLKKPLRIDGLDLTTGDLRRQNCEEEVRLNRRLAVDVYLGIVPVTREPGGGLALGGRGMAVDWLVQMRRLPREFMLDAVIQGGRAVADEAEIRAVAWHLAAFYRAAPPEPISGVAYREHLAQGVRDDLRELSPARFGLPRKRLRALAAAQLAFVDQCAPIFERRVNADHIVEGHGDLRPEHISLRPAPAVIDCLEFAKELRLQDPADELAFLALECDRLGEPRVGQWFLDVYTEVTGDAPPAPLLQFYRVYRALRRATIAVRHLDDPRVRDPGTFAARARRYLELVEPVTPDPAYAYP